jgi:hypothetical protein
LELIQTIQIKSLPFIFYQKLLGKSNLSAYFSFMKFLISFFILLTTSVNAQHLKAQAIGFNAIQADVFGGYDAFGYQYTIKNQVFLKQKDQKGIEYKNLALGKIKKVDIQNPLKMLLFYEEFNTIVTLDNQLNETQKINFSDQNPPIVVAATAMASQNRFWIYNSLTQQIGFFDYLKNNYIPITQSLQGDIKYYEADFNYFYWIDDKNNGYQCNIFGNIVSLGKMPDFDKIQFLSPKSVLFLKAEVLYFQDFTNEEKIPLENSHKSIKSFCYKDQILSIFTTEGITNYKIILP